ncbi:MAG TPA: DUF2142 domain-containing protein [Vicingus sp.]|nr:DUF2142 domain-containing protein [Vicingus sp.]
MLVFLAIRLIPIGKWVLASVALFPISIQQAASMSSDVMTLGVVFISIATITRIFFQQNKVTKRQFIFLCIMSILLGLTKPTNLTVLILLLFVPKIKFNNNFDKFKKILAILLLGVLFEILWLIGTKYAGYNNNYQEILGLSQGIKPIEQLKYIFFNPLEFAETFLRSFVYEGTKSTPTPDFYIESMFGYMSLLSYKIPNFFMVLAYIGLFIALLYDKTKMSVKNLGNYAIGYFLVFVLSIIAVAVALYVVWTNVGAPQIAGIQGRYFLPIIPLLIVPFNYMTKFIIIKTDSTIRIGQIIFGISLINLSVASIITCIWFY